MRRHLILFCGGPAIASAGLPKPLVLVGDSTTMLSAFLRTIDPTDRAAVTLLVEDEHFAAFSSEVARMSLDVRVSVRPCASGSSTLEKLTGLLPELPDSESLIECTYPDLFFSGDLSFSALSREDLSRHICISYIPISSRFPRLMVDEYGGSVRAISTHTSPVPANPYHIFGGHLLARTGTLRSLLDEFLKEHAREETPSLEFDFLSWAINRSLVRSLPLYGQLIHADSAREIDRLRGEWGLA